jgi:endonuclease/exonuclease/phosphatase (EEP) superfamily protein YafD
MSSSKLSVALKVLILIFIGIVAAMIFCRNHFILGSILIAGRWPFVAVAFYFLWISLKRALPRGITVCLMIVLSGLFGDFFWNRVSEKKEQDMAVAREISLMTYNMYFRNGDIESSIQIIDRASPDLLLIQELTPAMQRRLESSIASKYLYRHVLESTGTDGIGIYSKYPIILSDVLRDEDQTVFAQVLELAVADKKVLLINVHLASTANAVEHPEDFLRLYGISHRERTGQLAKIRKASGAREKEFQTQIIAGDFNFTRFETTYRDVKNDWIDLFAHAGSGLGFNFPNVSQIPPLVTLDYVFTKGAAKPVTVKVFEGGGSDHQAILAMIGL